MAAPFFYSPHGVARLPSNIPPVARFFTFLLFALLFARVTPAAAQGNAYVDSLLAQAEQQKLQDDRYWRLLLHYQKSFLRGDTSEVMEPSFFNAPDGMADSRAELESTLRAFFIPVAAVPDGAEHPLCNFPARAAWLKERLAMDPAMLPAPQCARLDHWLDSLDINRVTVVYASYYMSSPASMFGHTLLRLDRAGEKGDTVLLNYGVNYAANMDTDNPILMAYKGMFGLFAGVYSTFPYYMKVQEYSNMEARDIWEYELTLDREQIHRLLLHLWEIGDIRFRYFYFRENCAFEILALLEAGKPSLRLTDHFPVATVPSQTIKALYAEEGLVGRRVFRPSLTTRLNAQLALFSAGQRKAFDALAAGGSFASSPGYAALDENEKAPVLDAYLNYRQYHVMRERTSEEDSLLKHQRNTLLERSRLAAAPPPASPPGYGPEEGHESNKLSLGGGWSQNGGAFESLSYRPAYHDLLSHSPGYAENSQIIYFQPYLRYYNSGRAVLEQLQLVDLVSITPHEPLFRNTSWQVGFGFRSLRGIGCPECQAFYVSFGDGYALRSPGGGPAIFYAMLTGGGELAERFNGGYRIGAGLDVGILMEEGVAFKTQLYGKALRYPLGDISNDYQFGLRQRYAFDKNRTLSATVARVQDANEVFMTMDVYF